MCCTAQQALTCSQLFQGAQTSADCLHKVCTVQAPPTNFTRPVQLSQGLYVCGDHRDSATLDGALKSGRRAAEAILASSAAMPVGQQPVTVQL